MGVKRYRPRTAGPVDAESMMAIIGAIYESALDPMQWQTALRQVADAIGGHRSQMFVPDAKPGSSMWVAHGIDVGMMSGYAEHYRVADLWTNRCARFLTASGATVSSEMVAEDSEYLQSEFWNDFCRPMDIFRVACVAVEIPPNAPSSGTLLTVYRPRSDDRFDENARDFLARIQPHVLRSLRIGRLLASAGSQHHTMKAMLAASVTPMFACTADARLVYANPAGEMLLRANDALIVRSSRLCAVKPSATTQLKAAIGRACGASPAEKGGRSGESLVLPRVASSAPMPITVSPLPRDCETGDTGDIPQALIVAHHLAFDYAKASTRLKAMYGLTNAELRVMGSMLRGGTLADAASRLGIRPSTAKTHLKRIFEKTTTHRQSELVRRILELAN